jgi:putative colanic acid biosynthesis UDP-glucose lipid carrier transferase
VDGAGGVLLLCGYATRSIGYFDEDVLLRLGDRHAHRCNGWRCGSAVVLHQAALPRLRRRAIVVGAGPLGVKVARTLGDRRYRHRFRRLLRRPHRRARARPGHGPALGGLKDVASYIRTHGIREVYITLPLGSQPRIVELLEQMQDTTASLFFVPDVFGISIIQGRLQDMNGVPVVGICETPFTGTNELIKRAATSCWPR